MYKYRIIINFILAIILIIPAAFSQPDPKEILVKSVKAYGGLEKLTKWKTMVTKGIIILDRSVNIKMKGAMARYIIRPDKLRLDQDFTAFEPNNEIRSYIYNNDQAWSIANLVPFYSANYKPALRAALDRIDGIAFFLQKAQSLYPMPDEIINGNPVYVIKTIVEKDTSFLYISKKNYFLVQDSTKNTKMVYSAFKKFGGIYSSTAYNQIVYTPQRVVINKFMIDKIEYNVKIDPEIFEEEKPKPEIKK